MAPRPVSPLSLVICTIFFFSTNVLAVAAVLGVDLGTGYIKAALVKPGIPLEIVLTKDSRRKEISAVTFKPSKSGPKAGEYPERLYGSDAMALAARFPHDVYPNLKALLGLPVGHSIVQEYAARHPALQLVGSKVRDTAAFKSKAFTAEEEAWMIEELLAMELQSVQQNAQATAGSDTSVQSLVLTVPPYFTTEEKRSIQLAAKLAGLKVLSLISDGLAVGLNYATSRQFPNLSNGEKPEYHMVFDMGAGSTKATIMKFQSRTVKDIGKFNKTIQEVQVLGSGWDRSLGGDALNSLIVDDMIAQFIESKGAVKISAAAENVKAHGRAIAKLSKEAERLRHILSANSNAQTSFEGLYEDVDFKYKLSRADFEKMAEVHAERVGVAIQNALKMAQLEISDLASVILHGGASRTPFVQKQLEQVLGSAEKIRTNVNSDESAVFGAAFRAADLSPSFRVKEIRITEGPMYPIGMKWTNANNKAQSQRLWSAISPLGGVAKEVSFNNREDFSINFYQQLESEEHVMKVLSTKNLTASVTALKEKYACLESDMALKINFKLRSENGEVQVAKATIECESETPEKETFVDGVKNLFGFGKKDQQVLKGDETAEEEDSAPAKEEAETTQTTSTTETTKTDSASTTTSSPETTAEPAKTKKLIVIPIDYSIENSGIPDLSKDDTQKSKNRLKAFTASDTARRQREEALNQLEGYTYKVRDLLENEPFIAASTPEERQTLENKSSDASDWLYGDGAEATKDELKKKLKQLEDIVSPIQKRIAEAEKRPALIASLKDALNQTTAFMANIVQKLDEYDEWHSSSSAAAAASPSTSTTEAPTATPSGDFEGLEDDASTTTTEPSMEDLVKERGPVPPLYKREDLKPIEDLYKSTSAWLAEMEEKQNALPPTANPVLLAKDLKSKQDKLEKAGMDLAMKGVNNFESKTKKASKKAKDKAKASGKPSVTIKTGATAKADAPDSPEHTIDLKDNSYIKFGGDGETLTKEQIEEMIKNFKVEQPEGGKEKDDRHDEL
jgi:hypoxia up-regulated 1